jgi:hypothetical protein
MLSRRSIAIASLSTIVCSGAAVADEGFKSSKFLSYPAESQTSYIDTAVVAATVVVSLNSAAQAKCLGAWVSKHRGGSFAPVIEVMRKYPDDHPMGLIIAVLQKDCGEFKYAR